MQCQAERTLPAASTGHVVSAQISGRRRHSGADNQPAPSSDRHHQVPSTMLPPAAAPLTSAKSSSGTVRNGTTPVRKPARITHHSVSATDNEHRHEASDFFDSDAASASYKTRFLGGLKGMLQKRGRSESLGSENQQDIRKALFVVRARRREERVSADSESSIGLDPKYVPFVDDAVADSIREEEVDEFNDDQEFRQRSFSNDVMIMRKTSRPMTVEVLGALKMDANPYTQYLGAISCYDLAPNTGQVIMLDKGLTIQKGFAALLQDPERVGLIYDTDLHIYLSLVTQTDFLRMLHHARVTGDLGLHKRPLLWWYNVTSDKAEQAKHEHLKTLRKQLHALASTETALEGVRKLCQYNIQRVPILDDRGGILYFLGLRRVLGMLQKQIRGQTIPPWMLHSVKSAQIGTWSHVSSVSPDTSLLDASHLLLNNAFSTLPVIREGKLLNVLTKSDIVFYALHHLIADEIVDSDILNELMITKLDKLQAHHLEFFERTVADALAMRSASPYQAAGGASAFCHPSDTVISVIDKLVACKCRCVYVLNARGEPEAAVSTSDVTKYLVIEQHPITQPPASPRRLHSRRSTAGNDGSGGSHHSSRSPSPRGGRPHHQQQSSSGNKSPSPCSNLVVTSYPNKQNGRLGSSSAADCKPQRMVYTRSKNNVNKI